MTMPIEQDDAATQVLTPLGEVVLQAGFNVGNQSGTAIISPAQLSAEANNYNPTGLQAATVLRMSANANVNITGITAPLGGKSKLLFLLNVTAATYTLTLKNANTNSNNANQILGSNAANVVVRPTGGCFLWYDQTSASWRVIGP